MPEFQTTDSVLGSFVADDDGTGLAAVSLRVERMMVASTTLDCRAADAGVPVETVFPDSERPAVTSVQQVALSVTTLHGHQFRLALTVTDKANNSVTVYSNCLMMDRTRPNVTVAAVAASAGAATFGGGSDTVVVTDDGSAEPLVLTSGVRIVDDVAPLMWYTTCWSSSPYGTCDLEPAEMVGGYIDAERSTAPQYTFTQSKALSLVTAGDRADRDGLLACMFVYVRSSLVKHNAGISSSCVVLDFSPPSSGVVVDGPLFYSDDAFLAATASAFVSWHGEFAVGARIVFAGFV
jgi:hypothetical protein